MVIQFNVYLGNYSTIIKDWTCVLTLDEYKLIGTHWFAKYIEKIIAIYFDSLDIYILKDM